MAQPGPINPPPPTTPKHEQARASKRPRAYETPPRPPRLFTEPSTSSSAVRPVAQHARDVHPDAEYMRQLAQRRGGTKRKKSRKQKRKTKKHGRRK